LNTNYFFCGCNTLIYISHRGCIRDNDGSQPRLMFRTEVKLWLDADKNLIQSRVLLRNTLKKSTETGEADLTSELPYWVWFWRGKSYCHVSERSGASHK